MKRLYAPLAAVLLAFVLSDCTSCASSPTTTLESANPFAQCKTVGACYLATAGTYHAAQEAGLDLIHNPDTPPSVKDAIKAADAKASPAIFEMSTAYTLYKHVKADLNTCAPDDSGCLSTATDKILVATANVQKWLTEAGPLVTDLLTLTGGE